MSFLHDTLRATASTLLGQRAEDLLPLDAQLAVGAGYAALTRDGVPVYEAECFALEDVWTVRDAERLAAREPARDWCIHLVALRDERHYRRTADGRWVLYRRGYGLS
jgi:HD superfamily phosphodiesterase